MNQQDAAAAHTMNCDCDGCTWQRQRGTHPGQRDDVDRLARAADALREHGWIVVSPDEIARLDRTEHGTILMECDPPAARR